jgi:hypothetical protein
LRILHFAAEVIIGSRDSPYKELYGYIEQNVSAKGQPMRLDRTRYEVVFNKVYVRGTIETGSLARPTSGRVESVSIGGMKISLASGDLSNGVLETREFGRIPVYVSSVQSTTMFGQFITRSCTLVVNNEQMKAIRATAKIKPLPDHPDSDMVDFLKKSAGK